MNDDKIFCPLVEKKIDIVDCMENCDIKDEYIPPEYKEKANWKEICSKCKYRKY